MPAPAYDTFADAIEVVIETDGGTWVSDSIAMDYSPTALETGEPANPAGGPYGVGGRTIWFRIAPANSGSCTLHTSASVGATDTEIGLYTGSSVDALTRVAGDSDSGTGNNSQIVYAMTGGEVYHLQVGNYGGGQGSIILTVTGPATVGAGDPDDPVDLLAARVAEEFNTLRAELMTPETVRDTVAAALVQGANVTITNNDGADTITISAAATDPEVVRDTIQAALVQGSNITITSNDGADTITIASTGGGGGGASAINDLSDVDTATAAPTDGQVLVWDASTSQWRPGTATEGGPEVGAWENNLETAFVYPAVIEVDRQSNPIVLPNGRQSTPTIEITVTEAMLVANNGADLGHETGIQILLTVRVTAVSGTGNTQIETAVWRAATGTETLYTIAQTGAPGSTGRIALSAFAPHVKVGDKVRVRVWGGTNAPNLQIEWWAQRSVVSKIGNKVNAGRIGLFRDIVRTGNAGTIVPTTVLTAAPTSWQSLGGDVTRDQWLDNGVLVQQNTVPAANATRLADPLNGLGIMTLDDGIGGTSTSAIQSVSNVAAYLHGVNTPLQFRMDRLWVPVPPT